MNRSVKRIIALTALWLCAAFAIAQSPIGVCLNNVAQTISNGVIAPIPYATVALCTPGSTASNCIANKVSIYTSTALSTATPTNPFTADAGGNYFFCAHVGHYGLLINSSYGQYFVPDVTLDDDWSKGGTMTGALTDAAGFVGPLTGNVTGNVSGNASTASASDHSPTQCGSGLYSQGDTTSWSANCAQVLWGQIGSIPSFYYQTVQEAGSALTQQPALNFDGTVVATNGTGKTNVGLPTVGTAGTYGYPVSMTTDAQGRVSSVTGGTVTNGWTSGNNGNGYWVKDPTGHIHQWGHLTSESGGACNMISFPTSFTNAASIVPSATDDFSVGSSIQHSIATNSAHSCAAPTTTAMYDWESSGGNGVWWTADGY